MTKERNNELLENFKNAKDGHWSPSESFDVDRRHSLSDLQQLLQDMSPDKGSYDDETTGYDEEYRSSYYSEDYYPDTYDTGVMDNVVIDGIDNSGLGGGHFLKGKHSRLAKS